MAAAHSSEKDLIFSEMKGGFDKSEHAQDSAVQIEEWDSNYSKNTPNDNDGFDPKHNLRLYL